MSDTIVQGTTTEDEDRQLTMRAAEGTAELHADQRRHRDRGMTRDDLTTDRCSVRRIHCRVRRSAHRHLLRRGHVRHHRSGLKVIWLAHRYKNIK